MKQTAIDIVEKIHDELGDRSCVDFGMWGSEIYNEMFNIHVEMVVAILKGNRRDRGGLHGSEAHMLGHDDDEDYMDEVILLDDEHKVPKSSYTRVECISNDYVHIMHNNSSSILIVGNIYHLLKEEVHSWHTKFYLLEFPDSAFNSVCFEVLPPEYDKNFGDDKICDCGHEYYRHFDSWESMRAVGCKYCGCETFVPPSEEEE